MPAPRHTFGLPLRCLVRMCASWVIAFSACRASAAADEATAKPSFAIDVMQTLSKSGCNLGTCHGNANGKGGFKISLRGQDAKLDYLVLTHDQMSRRINVQEPDKSLLLLKATMQQAHE